MADRTMANKMQIGESLGILPDFFSTAIPIVIKIIVDFVSS